MPQCANCVKASKLADVPAVQSDFMEFLQRLSATWMPAAPRVLAPKITCPDSKQLFQMMNFGIQKGIILLFWIIVAKQGLGWSGWNGIGPMKLHKIYEATTGCRPFLHSHHFGCCCQKIKDHHPPDRLVCLPCGSTCRSGTAFIRLQQTALSTQAVQW
jgi:hypothetical protein